MMTMPKRIFVAAYRQSPFGKLGAVTIPEIIHQALTEVSLHGGFSLEVVDTASVGGCLTPLIGDQVLLSGLVASERGLQGKPIETVENACATGGQAILSVVYKLLLGEGEVGIALGVEKMRDHEGKADGKRIGKVLGTASHPDDRPGKVFVFPHLFAEVMDRYMKEWCVTERDLAHVPVTFYEHAAHNPYAQMRGVAMTVEKVLTIEGPNRYIAEGLPLKTFECSQISDGWAAIVLATEEGLRRLGVDRARTAELVGFGQATDPLSTKGRDVLRVVDDQVSRPAYTADLAPLLVKLLASGAFGLYHLANQGICSRFEWARHILKSAGLKTMVQPAKTGEFSEAARRPAYSALDLHPLDEMFGKLPPWQDATDRFLVEMGERR